MAKRGLGKTSGRHGSRPDTRVVTTEEARTGQAALRSGGPVDLPPAAAGAAREAEELQAFIGHGPSRTADEARLLTDFFSVPPPAPELEDLVFEEPVRAKPRAMWLTMGLLSASLALIGGYWAYQQLYVPQPVELGSDEPVMVLESPLPELALPAAVSGEVAPTGAPEEGALAFAAAPADPTVADPTVAQPEAAAAVTLGEAADPVEPPGAPTPTETQVNAATQTAPAAQPAAAAAADSTGAAVQPGSGQGATQPPAAATPGIVAAPPSEHVALPGDSGSSPGSNAARAESASVPGDQAGPAANALPPSAAADGVERAEAARTDAPSFEVLLEQAESLSRRGQSAEAVTAFERALQRQPGAAAALAGKAYAHLNLNDQRSAKALAEQAVAADPTSSRAWIVLGAAEELLGSRSAAQAAYRQCAAQGVGRYVDECRKLAR